MENRISNGKPHVESLIWFLTSKCNLKCKHCYYYGEQDKSLFEGELKYADFKKFLPNILSWGVRNIHFLGGEPTVHPDFLGILALCSEQGISTSFNTNSINLDEKYVSAIRKHEVTAVTFSIEGPDRESNDFLRGKGAFEKTVEAINLFRRIRSKKAPVKLPLVALEIGFNRRWNDKVERMLGLIEDIEPDMLLLQPTKAEGRALISQQDIVLTKDEIFLRMPDISRLISNIPREIVYELAFPPKWIEYGNAVARCTVSSQHICNAVKRQCTVTPNGDVIPCLLAPQIVGEKNIPKIDCRDFNEVLSSHHFQNFFRIKEKNKDVLPEICQNCTYRYLLLCEPCPLSNIAEKRINANYCQKAIERLKEMSKLRS